MLSKRTRIIGLTGPIASGKNEAAKILRRQGALIIDADEVAHTLYITQSPVWQALVRAFGSRILNRGGKINRKKLGEMVFSDRQKLQELDRIVHPYLKKSVIQKVEEYRAQSSELRTQIIVINAAVLKEIGLVDYVDRVWVVMAPKAKRLKRLLEMGLTKKEAISRMQSQMSQREYLKNADIVIQNDGKLKELSRLVRDLL